jgi:hypothetical protein
MYCGAEVSGSSDFSSVFESEKCVILIMQCFPQAIPFFRGDAACSTMLLDRTSQQRTGAAADAG